MVETLGLHPVHKLTHVLHVFSLHDVLVGRQGLHFPLIARARNHILEGKNKQKKTLPIFC